MTHTNANPKIHVSLKKQRRHYNTPALYAAEDVRHAAAVLALAVAQYLFCAALYATEDFRPGLAAVFFECHIFCAALNAAEDVLTA